MNWLLVLLVAALVLAAFAAAAETALTSVSRIRMSSLADEGDSGAKRVVRLHNDPNAYLSTILTVNTVAVIVASTALATLVVNARGPIELVDTIALSLFVLVFCEIAPKSLALRFNERFAMALSAPVAGVTWLLRPLVSVLTLVSRGLLRAATAGRAVRGPFVTEEELRVMLAMGEQQGVVEQEERQMIHGILEMTDKTVREIMVPRVDVTAVDVRSTANQLIDAIVDYGHSRIPIYEETMDNIIGVVYAKDLLRHDFKKDDTRSIRMLVREPYYTPEAKHVGELLHEMQERKIHMAIVVDEHGGTAGIVTFEDLIEEIVGPIRDEYDSGELEEIQILSDREVLLSARYSVDDLRDELGIDIGETDADSVGGLIYERLGEIPISGATVDIDGARFVVESVRRQGIQTVRVSRAEPFLSREEQQHAANEG